MKLDKKMHIFTYFCQGIFMIINRKQYLDELISKKDNGRVKIITGIRRCGKSYLLFKLYKDFLLKQGVSQDQIIELALDDISNIKYRHPFELNDYNHVFALREIGYENGILIQERYNESGARVYGGNLEGKVAYRDFWSLQLGLTYQRAEYKDARSWSEEGDIAPTKKMFRTPNLYGYFTTNLNPVGGFNITLSGTYTGKMLVEHHKGYIAENKTETTPQFFDMLGKLSYDFKLYKRITLQVNAGVGNIFNSYQKDFDQGVNRDSGYIYGPGAPRTYFAGIKLSY